MAYHLALGAPKFHKAQGTLWKRIQKACKSQRWWMAPRKLVFQIPQYWCTYEPMEPMAARICPEQVQARWACNTEIGNWTQGLVQNQETICNWYPLPKGKSVLSNGVSICISMTLQDIPHFQEFTQNELQGVCFVDFFFILFCFGAFLSYCLFWF